MEFLYFSRIHTVGRCTLVRSFSIHEARSRAFPHLYNTPKRILMTGVPTIETVPKQKRATGSQPLPGILNRYSTKGRIGLFAALATTGFTAPQKCMDHGNIRRTITVRFIEPFEDSKISFVFPICPGNSMRFKRGHNIAIVC